MSGSEPPDPLARLGAELDRARAGRAADRAPAGDGRSGTGSMGSALGLGMRIGIELVAALCVGLALGWVCDRYLGTRPFGLIVFFFLGAAAGIMNVFRAVKGLGYGGGPPPGPDGKR